MGTKIKYTESLFITNPELRSEWNVKKNEGINPELLTAGSGKKVWWICNKGHEWEAAICSRANTKRKTGCPICKLKKIVTGINDLFTTNPELECEWDYSQNILIDPRTISRGSNKKAWWICKKCNYSWQAVISSRGNGKTGCPACAGNIMIKGKNDLATLQPQLANEWNFSKNRGLQPDEVAAKSDLKVWWKCKNGHEWEARIGTRSRKKGTGCPYCSGRFAIEGINDLESLYPQVAKEWNYERNVGLLPSEIKTGSSQKVWWKCSKCGYEWESTVYHRIEYRSCPHCSGNGTSYPEQAILFYVKKVFSDVIHRDKHIGKELDIYIPSLKVAIEYDGELAHKSSKRLDNDNKKDVLCREKGIKLIRIRDESLPDTISAIRITHYGHTRKKSIEECIIGLFKYLNCPIDFEVNTEKDFECIMSNYYVPVKSNNLVSTNPDLISEWYMQKNGNLRPEHVTNGSERKVWWKCSNCNYVWCATINSRAKGSGCPKCAGKVLVEGENDLFSSATELMLDWDYSKNDGIDPKRTSKWSKKKVWWRCHKCEYEWIAQIGSRFSGIGCPKCSGRVLIKGENDLDTKYPDIAREWNYEKNENLKPDDFFPNSNRKVWWICYEGHEWETNINSRTREGRGTGCPICSGKKILTGYNDLATRYPELISEWDYSKNDIKPTEVSCHSGKKVWWVCSKCRYEWETIIDNRTKGHGCPKCNGQVKATPEEFKTSFDKSYPWLELLSDYEGASRQLTIKCRNCGYVWNRRASKLIEGYMYCPRCKKE